MRWFKKDKITEYLYNQDEIIVKNVKNIFQDLVNSNILSSDNKIANYFEKFNSNNLLVLSQAIDSYGKTRQVNIEYKSQKVSLITTPIQPLRVVIKNNTLYKTSLKIAIAIFEKLDMKIVSQTVIDDTIKQVNASNGSDIFTIITNDDKIPLRNIERDSYLQYTGDSSSNLTLYNKNKKIARYLSEYVLWHFSNYVEENKIQDADDDIINEFSENMIVIEEDYEYDNIPKTFSKKSPVFQDRKLVVTSLEMLKRLIYFLRLRLKQQYEKVLSYNENKVIPNYYSDLTDFDTHPNQTILQGGDSIYKWNTSLANKVYVYDRVIPELITPYFFKNLKINNRVYLAQNTPDIDTAIKVSKAWQEKSYNIGYNGEYNISEVDFSYKLYSYVNEDDITTYIIGEQDSRYLIIGYKIDETPKFTTLLEI